MVLDSGGVAFEVSSGTGQHIVHFAEQLSPKWTWLPSDCEQKYLSSITAYIQESKLPNIKKPTMVDITDPPSKWWVTVAEMNGVVDFMLNVNMMHITPIQCTHGLFEAAGTLLKSTGKLITYGPYAVDGVLSPQSNIDFDAGLRARNPEWGVRDTAFLKPVADKNGLELTKILDMPSNNKCLVFVKR